MALKANEVPSYCWTKVQENFQNDVKVWLLECFGEKIACDAIERNHRFLEESLELVQACGCTASEAHQLVDYVFRRPVGEKLQECGGVMVTLAALCLAQRMDMMEAGIIELLRCWEKIERIRQKQAAKPEHSPLPAFAPIPPRLIRYKMRIDEFSEYIPIRTDAIDGWVKGSECAVIEESLLESQLEIERLREIIRRRDRNGADHDS
jgi:hypothetical protein